MFHYLQHLKRSMARPRRRRQLRTRPVSCEAFETRLVLSAVTALSAIELLPVDADSALPESVDITKRFVAPEFAGANFLATQDDATPPRQEGSPPEFGDGQGNPPNFAMFPSNALDSVFGDLAHAGNILHPDQPPRHRPPLSMSTDDATSDSVFENTVEVSQQTVLVESDVQPLTTTGQTNDNDAVEADSDSADGFVEIPRSVAPASSLGGLLQDSLNSDDAGSLKLSTPFFDLSSDNEQPAVGDDDSAIDAAMAFFNRQTDGGFVDAGLDDLRAAAAGIAGIHRTGNRATNLEAGLGRFNPFDDRSHMTMLTAIELRHAAETDTGRDGEHSVGAEAALAGIVLGTVGLQHGRLERLRRTLREIVTRLGSFFLSDR